jgi:hypothetical protein
MKKSFPYILNIILCVSFVFLMVYRNLTEHTRFVVDQRIIGGSGRVELVTTITHEFEVLDMWSDPPSDSIKCIRYRQAKKLADHYKHIENLKCK